MKKTYIYSSWISNNKRDINISISPPTLYFRKKIWENMSIEIPWILHGKSTYPLISTRSIDRWNKNWVSCFSRFSLRVLYLTFIQKMIKLEGRILLRHLIDPVELWRKSRHTHHWSRLIKKLRSFEISRQWNVYISFIIPDQWWIYVGFLHLSTRSIQWCNEIRRIPMFMFSQISTISISLIPMKIVKNWPSLKSEFSCSIR